MKTYEQVINSLVQNKWHTYMSGASDTRVEGIGLVAYIYGKTKTTVNNDVLAGFGELFKSKG